MTTRVLSRILILLCLVTSAASAQQQQPRRFTGEPVSLNLKDLDVRDFFRLIHEFSKLNIVVDPAVRGTVTLAITDVPWDQALDVVLRNNGLTSELQGSVLRVMTRETARREQEMLRELAQARALAVPRRTMVRKLSYARATDAAAILRKFLSPRGEIAADERTNTLIITDIPSALDRLSGPLANF